MPNLRPPENSFFAIAANKPYQRWWHGLLALSAAGLGIFFIAAPIVLIASIGAQKDSAIDLRVIFVNLLFLALLLPIFLTTSYFSLKLSVGEQFSYSGRLAWRWLAITTSLSFVGYLTLYILLRLGELKFQLEKPTWIILLIIIFLLPLQCAAEEVVFRGFLPQVLTIWLGDKTWQIAVTGLISSTCFAIVHGEQNLALFAARFAAGALFFVIVWYTNGLITSIGLHYANNAAVLILGLFTGTFYEEFQTKSVSWTVTISHLVFTAVLGVILIWLRTKTKRPVAQNNTNPVG